MDVFHSLIHEAACHPDLVHQTEPSEIIATVTVGGAVNHINQQISFIFLQKYLD